MSFQDFSGGHSIRQFRKLPRSCPRSAEVQATSHNNTPRPKRPMLVLHGRVVQKAGSEDLTDEDQMSRAESFGGTSQSVRSVMERKSIFAKLSHETQIFGRMVADLEGLLAESGESPESAWRARILMRSAQETDKELWAKLHAYERTLHGNKSDPEIRQAQTACMKLHRDFKRVHRSLVLALSSFEQRQKAEVSRLGAVGWSAADLAADTVNDIQNAPAVQHVYNEENVYNEQKEPDLIDTRHEDYFDRVMREREAFDRAMRAKELTEINKKMHSVNDIYNDLAELVDQQQDQIDVLADEADYTKETVKSATRTSVLDLIMCGPTEYDSPVKLVAPPGLIHKQQGDIDWQEVLACGDISAAAESLKESYGIVGDDGGLGRVETAESLEESYAAIGQCGPHTVTMTLRDDLTLHQDAAFDDYGPHTVTPRDDLSLQQNADFDHCDPHTTTTRDDLTFQQNAAVGYYDPHTTARGDATLQQNSTTTPKTETSDSDDSPLVSEPLAPPPPPAPIPSSRARRSLRRRSKSRRREGSKIKSRIPTHRYSSRKQREDELRGENERDSNLRVSEEFHWMMPFETLTEDVKAVHSDLVGWGKTIISPGQAA